MEYRWFEATLHAGKVKSFAQLCLAVTAKALQARSACSHKRTLDPQSAKYDLRVFLLHLGMIGEEFKTARKHLLARMPGDAAFKRGRPKKQAEQDRLSNRVTTTETGAGNITRTEHFDEALA